MTIAGVRVRDWTWTWGLVLGLNLALATVAAVLSPSEANVSHTTDRAGYEYIGAHPLERPCPHAIYCYRLLVPVTLQAVPATPLERWRVFAVLANALAGFTIAAASARASVALTRGTRDVVPDWDALPFEATPPDAVGGAAPRMFRAVHEPEPLDVGEERSPVGGSERLAAAQRSDLPDFAPKAYAREPLVPMVLATILFQTSFGATFAIFDPFTPDPAVFLAAALITLVWLREQPWVALAVGLVGVWAKETVALIGAIAALATLVGIPQRLTAHRRAWLLSGAAPALLIGLFHVAANRALGWSEAGSGSADLTHGAWLARWLADSTLTPASRAFYLFIPFGFGWLYAVVGFNLAAPRLRVLGVATLVLIPVLVYVQTPERALANAFFAVIPLAVAFLVRLPWPLAVLAGVTNGLLTARVGLASDVLPPVPYGLVLAAIVGTLTLVWALTAGRRSSMTPVGSSAPLASSR